MISLQLCFSMTKLTKKVTLPKWAPKAKRSLSFQKKATVSGSENDADADADGDANDGCDKSVSDTNDGQAEDFLTLDEVISI